MDELTFRRLVYQIAMSMMKWQLVVLFVTNRGRYFVFVTAIAENLISHNYAVTTFIAFSDTLGQSVFTSNLNWQSLSASNLTFKEPTHDMSMTYSCSQVVSSETFLVAKVFLTHSNFQALKTVSAKHPSEW